MPDNNDPPKQGQDQDQHVLSQSTSSPYPSNTGRPGIGTIPRTIPLYLNSPSGSRTGNKHYTSHSVGSLPSNYSPTNQEGEDVEQDPATKNLTASLTNRGNFTPLMQTSTGTRYGLALSGGVGVHATGYASPSPRKWGAVTPLCPRCMKNVYFAEQVKPLSLQKSSTHLFRTGQGRWQNVPQDLSEMRRVWYFLVFEQVGGS